MTIYQARLDLNDIVQHATPLKQGEHKISFAGAEVLIHVDPDGTVSVFLSEAKGDLSAITIPEVHPGSLWTESSIKGYTEIEVHLENGESALLLTDLIERTAETEIIIREESNPIGRKLEFR